MQIAEVVTLLDKWGFSYVENLTWVHMAPNNTVVAAPSLYARRSHLSLFIFRKAGTHSISHTAALRFCSHTIIVRIDKHLYFALARCKAPLDFKVRIWQAQALRHSLWHAGEGKDIELRHQRNPDVLFDSVRREQGALQGMTLYMGCSSASHELASAIE